MVCACCGPKLKLAFTGKYKELSAYNNTSYLDRNPEKSWIDSGNFQFHFIVFLLNWFLNNESSSKYKYTERKEFLWLIMHFLFLKTVDKRVIFLPPDVICCGKLCTNLSLEQWTFSLVYEIYW
jgi:hypothetical protein